MDRRAGVWNGHFSIGEIALDPDFAFLQPVPGMIRLRPADRGRKRPQPDIFKYKQIAFTGLLQLNRSNKLL